MTQKYMLTLLADDHSFNDSFNWITNIQGITRTNLKEINLNSPKANSGQSTIITTTGFGDSESLSAFGTGHYVNHYPYETDAFMQVYDRFDEIDHDFYYLYSSELDGIPYAFYRLTTPLDDNFVLDRFDLIIDSEVDIRTFSINQSNNSPGFPRLKIYGYNTQQDYDQGIYHEIYSKTVERIFGGKYQYHLNTGFEEYTHQLQTDTYLISQKGLPMQDYTIPTSTIEFEQLGREINISYSDVEHSMGRIRLSPSDGLGNDYEMTVLFDSQATSTIILPEIPQEMKDLSIYNVIKNKGLDFEQVHLTSFDNILTYDQYLDLIIKNNEDHNHYSNTVISRMKSTSDGGTPFKTFHFD